MNTSSVGMLGTNGVPCALRSTAPFQTWPSGRPTVRSVPESSGVAERGVGPCGQVLAARLQRVDVAPPRFPRVRAVHAARPEDGVPQAVHPLVRRRFREHPRRPRGDRGRDHAPAHPHGADVVAPERLHLFGCDAHGGRHPLRILLLQQVGVAAGDSEERGALLGPFQHAPHAPGRELLERVVGRMPEAHQIQLVVMVGDVHVRASGLVRPRRQGPGQLRRLDRRADDQPLSGLQVQSHPDRQVGVPLQIVFHGAKISRCCRGLGLKCATLRHRVAEHHIPAVKHYRQAGEPHRRELPCQSLVRQVAL